jgi:hypothetical protein
LTTLRSDPTSAGSVIHLTKSTKATVQTSGLRLSFFFDGTGNNLDADLHTGEHSNVARLFRAHLPDQPSQRRSIYVPGIGTHFKDVGDLGYSTRGSATGAGGDARLSWAMGRFDRAIKDEAGTVHVALFGFSRGAWWYRRRRSPSSGWTTTSSAPVSWRMNTTLSSPGSRRTDGSLAKNMRIYDEQLVDDVKVLKQLVKWQGQARLRPHYRALLEAYEAEFDKKAGLKDNELIAFFDEYVHDSLAGFALDATLPSDHLHRR